MVESDNAKSRREFKKLSKSMGDKLDREKGRCVLALVTCHLSGAHILSLRSGIEELPAPAFKPTAGQEKLRQRAEEKEKAGVRVDWVSGACRSCPLRGFL